MSAVPKLKTPDLFLISSFFNFFYFLRELMVTEEKIAVKPEPWGPPVFWVKHGHLQVNALSAGEIQCPRHSKHSVNGNCCHYDVLNFTKAVLVCLPLRIKEIRAWGLSGGSVLHPAVCTDGETDPERGRDLTEILWWVKNPGFMAMTFDYSHFYRWIHWDLEI